MVNTLLSICIPTYNRFKDLEILLNSLKKQDFKNFELSIYDDASNDNTIDLIKKFSKIYEIKYLRGKINLGRANALKESILLSSGKYIIIMDSDDYFLENSLNDLNIILNENISNKIAGFVFLTANTDFNINGKSFFENKKVSNMVTYLADENIYGDKKEIILSKIVKENLYSNKFNERRVPTSFIWLQISMKYDVICFNKIIAIKNYYKTGMSNNINKIRMDSPYSSFIYYRDLLKMYKIKFVSKKFYLKTQLNLARFYLHTLDRYPNITSKELKVRKNYFFIFFAYLIYIFDKFIYKKT